MADAMSTVKRLLEEPWTGNMDVVDEFVSADYVGHDPSEPEAIRGPEGLKRQIRKYLAAFPDGRITVDDQFSAGSRVASRWTGRGTHDGELPGMAPTGKEVTVTGLTVSRLEGDTVVEEWTVWDTFGMMVQLGAVPMPANV